MLDGDPIAPAASQGSDRQSGAYGRRRRTEDGCGPRSRKIGIRKGLGTGAEGPSIRPRIDRDGAAGTGRRRDVRIVDSHGDLRVDDERGLVFGHDAVHDADHPRIEILDVDLFPGIDAQIVQPQQAVGFGIRQLRLITIPELPVMPFHGHDMALPGHEEDAVSAGSDLFPLEERKLVHAVDRPVLRDDFGRSDGGGDGREKVDLVNHVVGNPAGVNPPRPSDHARSPNASLQGGVVIAAPGARGSPPGTPQLGAVVAAKDDQRVRGDAQPLDGFHNQAHVGIHVRHGVPDVSGARRSGLVGMRQRGEVDLRHGIVEEKGLSLLDVSFHEGDSALGGFPIDRAPRLEVVGFHRARKFAVFRLPDLGDLVPGGIETLERGELGRMTGSRNPVPLVESLLGRLPPFPPVVSAHVILAENPRRIADRAESLGDRHLPQGHALRQSIARAQAVTPREQRDAGNDAVILDVEVRESHPLLPESVQGGRGDAACAAVEAHFSDPQVIGQDQDDVGTGRCGPRGSRIRGDNRLDREVKRRYQKRDQQIFFHHVPQSKLMIAPA